MRQPTPSSLFHPKRSLHYIMAIIRKSQPSYIFTISLKQTTRHPRTMFRIQSSTLTPVISFSPMWTLNVENVSSFTLFSATVSHFHPSHELMYEYSQTRVIKYFSHFMEAFEPLSKLGYYIILPSFVRGVFFTLSWLLHSMLSAWAQYIRHCEKESMKELVEGALRMKWKGASFHQLYSQGHQKNSIHMIN